MVENARPCPFCGGKAKLWKYGLVHEVRCETCGATTNYRTTGDAAIKIWNQRVIAGVLV